MISMYTQAAAVTGPLWTAIRAAGGVRPPDPAHRYFAAAFDARWLAGLPLPVGEDRPQDQPVKLLDDRDGFFDGYHDERELARAYVAHPRTRVFEYINYGIDDAWFSLVAQHLGRLSGSELEVVCSVFESLWGDEGLGAHSDHWYGVIVQIHGCKVWHIGEALFDDPPSPVEVITTWPGDILLIPKRLPHAVETPARPGHSLHLSFAIDRDDGSPEQAVPPSSTGAGHRRPAP